MRIDAGFELAFECASSDAMVLPAQSAPVAEPPTC